MKDLSILGSSFIKAEDFPDLEVVPLSIPQIGESFGPGGVPRGRAIEIYGEKSSGKTTFSLWLVKEYQRQGLTCAWAAAEPFEKEYAAQAGVDVSKLIMIDFGFGEDLTYKLKLALASNEFDLIVVDSINTVVPQGLSDATIETKSMNEKMEAPKMWAEFFKQIEGGYHITSPVTGKPIPSNVVSKIINPKTLKEEADPNWHKLVQKKTTMVFINHRLDKIGLTFGSKQYTPGGTRKDFTFSLRLNLDVKKTVTGKSKGQEVLKYKVVRLKPEKNKVGAPLKIIYLKYLPDGNIEFFGYSPSKEEIKENPFGNLKDKLDGIESNQE